MINIIFHFHLKKDRIIINCEYHILNYKEQLLVGDITKITPFHEDTASNK